MEGAGVLIVTREDFSTPSGEYLCKVDSNTLIRSSERLMFIKGVDSLRHTSTD